MFYMLHGDLAKICYYKNEYIESLIDEDISYIDINTNKHPGSADTPIRIEKLSLENIGQQLINCANNQFKIDKPFKVNNQYYLEFDKPMLFIDIYDKYIKNTSYEDSDINRVLYRLNNTEQKLRNKYPEILIRNINFIPDTLPIYAIAKMRFLSFNIDNDVSHISGFICDKLSQQIEAKKRGKFNNNMKRKHIHNYYSKRGCCEKNCRLSKESQYHTNKKNYKREVKQSINETYY